MSLWSCSSNRNPLVWKSVVREKKPASSSFIESFSLSQWAIKSGLALLFMASFVRLKLHELTSRLGFVVFRWCNKIDRKDFLKLFPKCIGSLGFCFWRMPPYVASFVGKCDAQKFPVWPKCRSTELWNFQVNVAIYKHRTAVNGAATSRDHPNMIKHSSAGTYGIT